MDFADNVKSGCRDFVKLVIILRYCPALQGRQMLDIDLCTGENGERRSVTHEFRVGHSIDKIKKPGRWIENKTIEKKEKCLSFFLFFFLQHNLLVSFSFASVFLSVGHWRISLADSFGIERVYWTRAASGEEDFIIALHSLFCFYSVSARLTFSRYSNTPKWNGNIRCTSRTETYSFFTG